MKFLIITPVRNEARFISVTIECMIKQSVQPTKWIIVNDGSSDNTEEIMKKFMKKFPLIQYISLPDRGKRAPGHGVVEAFYEGFKKIGDIDYDILAKFDGDLKFAPNTLKQISQAFNEDQKLGITGGTRYEQSGKSKTFRKVLVPSGFVGGPYKFYRRACFEEIGGLISRAGWDGVDTIKANMKGWKTGEIESLKIIHLKPTGSAKGEGLSKACQKYGDVSYYMGGYLWYFILRVVGRSLHEGNPKVGYHMIRGYIKSKMTDTKRESLDFRNFLKRKQMENLKHWFGVLLKRF